MLRHSSEDRYLLFPKKFFKKSLLQHLSLTPFPPPVLYFSISQPCISIHCSMKCDRKEDSVEWIIGRGCYTGYFVLCFGEGIERSESRKACKQQTEKSGWTVLLNQTLAIKPKEKLKRGGVYRCCGRGRENRRGDKEINGEGCEQSVLLV